MPVLVIDVAIPGITVFPGSWEQYESDVFHWCFSFSRHESR